MEVYILAQRKIIVDRIIDGEKLVRKFNIFEAVFQRFVIEKIRKNELNGAKNSLIKSKAIIS